MEKELINYQGKEIVGWCCNCKDPISEHEDHVVKDDTLYCLFCFNQITTFIDADEE